MIRRQVMLLGVALAFASPARAEQVMFMFGLDPGQEVQTPPVVSPGSGSGHVMYDTATNVIQWDISFQNLVANVSVAHFHGPAGPGFNASPILGVATTAVTSGVLQGSADWAEANEAALLDGLVYFNIHTTTFPGGEIRGQVVPEPATLAVLLLGAGSLMLRRRRP
jgi:hypothetical protein